MVDTVTLNFTYDEAQFLRHVLGYVHDEFVDDMAIVDHVGDELRSDGIYNDFKRKYDGMGYIEDAGATFTEKYIEEIEATLPPVEIRNAVGELEDRGWDARVVSEGRQIKGNVSFLEGIGMNTIDELGLEIDSIFEADEGDGLDVYLSVKEVKE